MKVRVTTKALKKNVMTTLTSLDVISHEAKLKKREAIRRKFIDAFKHTTGLVALKLPQYTKNTEHPPIVTLTELVLNLSHNSSVQLLDLSHNNLDKTTVQTLSHLLYVQKMPLEFLFLDYLNNSHSLNFTVIVDTLENHATLQTLSLQGNDLSHPTCQSIVHLLNSKTNHLTKILLTRCSLNAADLEEIQQAAFNRGKRFSLEIDNVNTTETQAQINRKSKSSSFVIYKTLTLPKTLTCLLKSDSDSSFNHRYAALFPLVVPLKEISPKVTTEGQMKSQAPCAAQCAK